jgi:hypothetical protein
MKKEMKGIYIRIHPRSAVEDNAMAVFNGDTYTYITGRYKGQSLSVLAAIDIDKRWRPATKLECLLLDIDTQDKTE